MTDDQYAPPRPILKRYLAENEMIRAAVVFCYGEFTGRGIHHYAIARSAGISQTHLRAYIRFPYVEYAQDENNYVKVGEHKRKAKNNHRYIPDESILRLCEYFRIEITPPRATLNPKRYETIGETLARMAEEKWGRNDPNLVGADRAQPNRAWVD